MIRIETVGKRRNGRAFLEIGQHLRPRKIGFRLFACVDVGRKPTFGMGFDRSAERREKSCKSLRPRLA